MRPLSTLYSLSRIAGRRIGLFGGSFNPAHGGHVAVAEQALESLALHEVWWLVSPQNPLKDSADTEDFEQRIAHARTLASHPRMHVTGLEGELGTRTTAQTFTKLAPMLELGNFVWIMGADSFSSLHKWNDWKKIPATLPLAVFARPGWSLKALGSPAARFMANYRLDASDAQALASLRAPAWVFINMPLRHESSTAIRNGDS